MNNYTQPGLVPELLVSDLDISLAFWCDLVGFQILYDRPEDRFAYIQRENTHIMLEQIGVGRNWITAPLEHPLGRGINLQITVTDLTEPLTNLNQAKYELFMPPETTWYRNHNIEHGVRQFLVTDPDGYLLRLQQNLGTRTVGISNNP
jgi:catechol 2,3-dioxygenase-like lactoylglutathione lyase family enzyme